MLNNMKKAPKAERLPQPICIGPRKLSSRPIYQPQTSTPASEYSSAVLQPISPNRMPLSSTSIISNMKSELSSIKLDVQKLILAEEPSESKLAQKMDIFNHSLKEELAYQKRVEEQLRREVRELKVKLADSRPREERLACERRIQELKASFDKERQGLWDRIRGLETGSENNAAIAQVLKDLEKANIEKKRLATQVLKLQQTIQTQSKQLSCRLTVNNQAYQLKSKLLEVQKERHALSLRLQQKDEDMCKLSEKYQAAIKQTEGKYYSSIAQFKNLSTKMEEAKGEELQAFKKRVQELQGELAEVHRKMRNRPEDYEQHLKREMAELKRRLEGSDEKLKLKKQQNQQLAAKIQQLEKAAKKQVNGEAQKQQIQYLQEKIQQLQQNADHMRRDCEEKIIQSIAHIREIEENHALEIEQTNKAKAKTQQQIFSLANKLKLVEAQCKQAQLQAKRRQSAQPPAKVSFSITTQTHPKGSLVQSFCQTCLADWPSRAVTQCSFSQTYPQPTTNTPCQTHSQSPSSPISSCILDDDDYFQLEQQVRKLQIQNMGLHTTLSQLTGQNEGLMAELRDLSEFSLQKDMYIKELEREREIGGINHVLRDLEDRCRNMAEERARIEEDYQTKIMRLENSLQEAKERNKQSRVSAMSGQDTTCFDEALKAQLMEIQQLKSQLKQKQQQVLHVRSQCDDWRRKAQALKSQTEIDKLKGVTEEKTLKNNYEMTIQNLKNQVDSHKRKQQTLQRKIQFKADELKRKDDFIQQVIVGKVGKDEKTTELEFIRKQLQKFFQSNYEGRLLAAQQRIKELEQKASAQ